VVEKRREDEIQRRSTHLSTTSESDHGRGKRKKKATHKSSSFLQTQLKAANKKTSATMQAEMKGTEKPSFAFLQTKFEELNKEERKEMFEHAWKDYKLTKRTNMLETFTTGLLFAQMSANKGIKKYGKEAELKLMAEFEQLLEYKVFHGKYAHELSYEQKRGAGDMLSNVE
jgi:hypothetical protein